MPVRIIGCGNIDRGDDGAGLLVARRLREMGTGTQEQSGEALSLIESWAGAEAVIVVDAVVSGKAPGEITVWDARAHPVPSGLWRGSTHHFGLAEAVELARVLDRLPPCLWIYGIEGRRFEQGSCPSPEVARAIEEVAERIARGVTGAAAGTELAPKRPKRRGRGQ
jgi:hydrogenase maturation protease